jgi:hypothetical protein
MACTAEMNTGVLTHCEMTEIHAGCTRRMGSSALPAESAGSNTLRNFSCTLDKRDEGVNDQCDHVRQRSFHYDRVAPSRCTPPLDSMTHHDLFNNTHRALSKRPYPTTRGRCSCAKPPPPNPDRSTDLEGDELAILLEGDVHAVVRLPEGVRPAVLEQRRLAWRASTEDTRHHCQSHG